MKIGPRTDPCGTPCSSTDQELNDLLILLLCQRSDITENQFQDIFKKSVGV